ncbi:HNH endonuclease [Belnapia sp. T6]|uniref:HNH endonuclease n=1 Tax=Belnapia mucosa TaxID=2804532 RepID=A0ABS1V5L1_9PROT|nr:HNH endonuclease [Belnapia mucosa]MBL6456961.1 HNH endonuclease [Belnapia mucosa]
MPKKAVAVKRDDMADLFNASSTGGKSVTDAELFSFPAVRRRYSDAELLADLRAFGAEFGPRDRTMLNYRDWPKRQFHHYTIIAQLGTWIQALRRAGLDHETRQRNAPTKADVEAELRRFAKATRVADRTLANFKDWRLRRISPTAVSRYFGSWFDAFQELGIAVPGRTKSSRHSEEEIIAAVERIWRWCGRPPSAEDFKKYARIHDDGISFGAVYYHFGALKPFLASFVQWKQGRLTLAQFLTGARMGRLRDPVRPKVRYALLNARNYTCDACGRSPKLHPGTVLHIDHVIPVSKGGTDDLSNLRVLCQVCNIGKGNRFAD